MFSAPAAAGSLDVRRVAKCLVEFDGSLHEAAYHTRADSLVLTQADGGHLVLAAWLQALFGLPQALATPESEKYPIVFRADEQHRAVREVDQVPPLDHFVQVGTGEDCSAQSLDSDALPPGEAVDVS